jgi:hypothetical protein
MKKFLMMLLMVAATLSMTLSNADARRLGGGGSFGKQSSGISRQTPSQPTQNFGNANQARPATPAATPQSIPPKPASPWKGILGGALLGLGLGALMSHFGLGGAFGSFLMMALLVIAVIFVVRMIMRKSASNSPAPAAYSGVNAAAPNFDNNASGFTPEIGSRINGAPSFQPSALQGTSAARHGVFLPISMSPVSSVAPRLTSSDCKRLGTRPISTTSANSRRRKCLASCACNCRNAALRRTTRMWCNWMAN